MNVRVKEKPGSVLKIKRLQPAGDRIAKVLEDKSIRKATGDNPRFKQKVRDAASYLFQENVKARMEEVTTTVKQLLEPLRDEKLKVFFSYKKKEVQVAKDIAKALTEWSAAKLEMVHMADFGVSQVGLDWRKKIEETIPHCHWFLLLMPNPEEDRDWILFEAGFFEGSHGFHRRLVCLHHSDTEVADALGEHQCVPAKKEAVKDFLEGLFHKPNWIPGMPAINPALNDLESKADYIVNLIEPTAAPRIRFCCGPHMELVFEDSSQVDGWDQIARCRVEEANNACKTLFGFETGPPPPLLADWIAAQTGIDPRNEAWVTEIVKSVKEAGLSQRVPPISGTILLKDGRRVRPNVCAVRLRKRSVEAIDILFTEVTNGPDTSQMSTELAALATSLEFAVRFRWEILERFAGKRLNHTDRMAFHNALMVLERVAVRDPRLAEDPHLTRGLVLKSFDSEDRPVVQEMYDRWDELRKPDATGELDLAIIAPDGTALEKILLELLELNKRFLSVTSARFARAISRT